MGHAAVHAVGEGALLTVPQRDVQVAAGALLLRVRLGEEARLQAERPRDLLDRRLDERGVVGGLHAATRAEVDLEQAGAGLGVHGGQLDVEGVQRALQLGGDLLERPDLTEAVADALAQRLVVLGAPQAHLVLERGHRLEPEIGELVERVAQDVPRGEIARCPVAPLRRGDAQLPPRAPRHRAQRVDLGHDREVGRAGADAERLVVRDRLVNGVEREQQVGHARLAATDEPVELPPGQRLAAQRSVDVRHPEEHEASRGAGDLVGHLPDNALVCDCAHPGTSTNFQKDLY
jgi:hypothetical protein